MTAFKHIFNNYLELSIVIFLWIFLPLHLCAQACDLQHDFKVTRSSGQIPNIFLHAIDGEIEKNIPNDASFSDKEKQEYAGFCKHTLSSIIKTGDLLFGDPMTQFVEKVGRRLLEKSEIPYSKYDFFVLKSHHTNALALEPGVIIVTTGLLSQIENEAQLAFVLSHEIAHLRANHLLKSYAHKEENINDDSFGFLQLAQMSKDFEVEADRNAVSIYQRAGYDQNEIDKTFLVLMYSYLPFDEVKIDSSFFNNANVYIPSSYFPDSPNPIVAFEEYTDVYSTHPNLKTRKAEIAQEVKKFENWESKLRFFDEAEFVKVRDIARFENMRQNHLKGYYIKTLYESSLLRNKYPENIYLAEVQASAWVQLHKIFLLNNKRNYFKNTNRAEGAMSMLYQFFMRLNAEELGALSMRMIEDLRIAFPKSEQIKTLHHQNIQLLAFNTSLDVKTFEIISFYDAVILNAEEMLNDEDNVVQENSKYDKIIQAQRSRSSSKSVRPLSDENFAYFLLYDLLDNEEFMERYEKEQIKLMEGRKPAQFVNSNSSKKPEYLLVNSRFTSVKNRRFSTKNTLNEKAQLDKTIVKFSEKKNIKDLRVKLFEDFSLEEYNRLAVVQDYFTYSQTHRSSRFTSFYIDQEEFDQVIGESDNAYLMFISGSYLIKSPQNRFYTQAIMVPIEDSKEIKYSRYQKTGTKGGYSVPRMLSEVFKKI